VNPLELPLVADIRRNHALEHATINVLSERCTDLNLVGRSDWAGFTLYGPVSTDEVAVAASIALERLRAGEGQLAVHPQCGTNVSTGIVLAGLASYAALRGKRRSRLEKALQLVFGLGAALTLAQPLGVKVQEHITTSTDVTALRVVDIRRLQRGKIIVHRIETKWE
jgi:hypothetical protein